MIFHVIIAVFTATFSMLPVDTIIMRSIFLQEENNVTRRNKTTGNIRSVLICLLFEYKDEITALVAHISYLSELRNNVRIVDHSDPEAAEKLFGRKIFFII